MIAKIMMQIKWSQVESRCEVRNVRCKFGFFIWGGGSRPESRLQWQKCLSDLELLLLSFHQLLQCLKLLAHGLSRRLGVLDEIAPQNVKPVTNGDL